ncbi:hypothetical protein EW146_g8301 [Bondarzewia mesenterica]|uniref:Uncharacterized protein n=1 Tax=Bondarzewia mesenterica TaxID=1095465 RepID=A0A4S4LFI4_9AGAM|nr:hypothetical protein EW146_g8301 [Bondarzewia mesenterica]
MHAELVEQHHRKGCAGVPGPTVSVSVSSAIPSTYFKLCYKHSPRRKSRKGPTLKRDTFPVFFFTSSEFIARTARSGPLSSPPPSLLFLPSFFFIESPALRARPFSILSCRLLANAVPLATNTVPYNTHTTPYNTTQHANESIHFHTESHESVQ